MEFLKYITTKRKMTNDCSSCLKCPLSSSNNEIGETCSDLEYKYPKKAEAIVENWLTKHPIKTRRQKFEEIFGTKIYPSMAFPGYASIDYVVEHEQPDTDNLKTLIDWLDEEYVEPKGES